MEKNNWNKPINSFIPYLTWESLSKNIRHTWNVNRHSNITYELHLILEGSCQVEIEDTRFVLNTGQAVIIRPGVFHSALSTSTPFLRFTLAFFIKNPALLFNSLPEEKPFMLFDTTPEIQELCHHILREHDRNLPCFSEEMLSSMFSQLWILLVRSLMPEETFSSSATLTELNDIRVIELFFSTDSKKQCTRKALSELLHCSERQVNRILFQLYGMNFRQKKQQARIDRAKFLLRNTDQKISEICILVGYADEAAFYKAFKANCNMTPQEFRSQNKQN